MTDPLDSVPQADDRSTPLAPLPAPAPAAAARPRSRTGQLFKWWLLSSIVIVLACIVCLAIGLGNTDVTPVHIFIDGDDVSSGLSIAGVGTGLKIVLAAGVVLLAIALLLLVPLLLLLVVGAVALALVAGLGMPLIALTLALAVVSSPLWLLGMFVWLVVRRRPAQPVTIHA